MLYKLIWLLLMMRPSLAQTNHQGLTCPSLPLQLNQSNGKWSSSSSANPLWKSWQSSSAGYIWSKNYVPAFRSDKQQLNSESSGVDTQQPTRAASNARSSAFCRKHVEWTWSTWWQLSVACLRNRSRTTTWTGSSAWTPRGCRSGLGCSRQSSKLFSSACATEWGVKQLLWWPPRPRNWLLTPSVSRPCASFGHYWTTPNVGSCSSGSSSSARVLQRSQRREPRRRRRNPASDKHRQWRRWRYRRSSSRRRRSKQTHVLRCCFLKLLSLYIVYSVGLVQRVAGHTSSLPMSTRTLLPLKKKGHPGPKSWGGRRTSATLFFYFTLLFSSIQPCASMRQAADVRVGGNPLQEPPGASSEVHFSGSRGKTNLNGVFNAVSPPSTALKRSFLRAQRRAMQHGGTQYKGRWYSAQQLGVQHNPAQPRPRQSIPPSAGSRLHFVSWNAGGLTTDRYAELRTWLSQPAQQCLDLAAIQETHWRGPLEFMSQGFFGVHIGGTKSEAGLLLLVKARSYPAHAIKVHDIVPGRLMHVRLESDPCTDIIIVYQHVWSIARSTVASEHSRDVVLSRRADIWARLHSLTASVPKRNQLLLLGDFNCSLSPDSNLVGRGVHQHSCHHATDSHMLMDLARNFGLVALNTWSRRGLRACTYHPATSRGHSQIDFAFCRLMHCDQQARQTKPVLTPFVPISGMRHSPLQGSIPAASPPKAYNPIPKITPKQIQAHCERHPEAMAHFQEKVYQAQLQHPDLTPATLLTRAWHAVVGNIRRPIGEAAQADSSVCTVTPWSSLCHIRLLVLRVVGSDCLSFLPSGRKPSPCKRSRLNFVSSVGNARGFALTVCLRMQWPDHTV